MREVGVIFPFFSGSGEQHKQNLSERSFYTSCVNAMSLTKETKDIDIDIFCEYSTKHIPRISFSGNLVGEWNCFRIPWL